MEAQTIIAHIIRKQRERFKLRDREQLDSENWLNSKETGLLAMIVCDIQEALTEHGMYDAACSFAVEAHPRKEKYTNDAPI